MTHDEIVAAYERDLHEGEEQENSIDPEGFRRGRFVLVQKSRFGGFWLTSFDSPGDAAEYHDGEEYPEDWPIIELLDTQTGCRYEAIQSTATTFLENCEGSIRSLAPKAGS